MTDTEIPLVFDNIITAGPEVHLQGAYCASCETYCFPMQEKCSGCLGELQVADLGNLGKIYSVTTIRTRAPLGLPSPYSVALVDMEDVPLRVFSLMNPAEAGRYQIGQPVELDVATLGFDNNKEPCRRPYFGALK